MLIFSASYNTQHESTANGEWFGLVCWFGIPEGPRRSPKVHEGHGRWSPPPASGGRDLWRAFNRCPSSLMPTIGYIPLIYGHLISYHWIYNQYIPLAVCCLDIFFQKSIRRISRCQGATWRLRAPSDVAARRVPRCPGGTGHLPTETLNWPDGVIGKAATFMTNRVSTEG